MQQGKYFKRVEIWKKMNWDSALYLKSTAHMKNCTAIARPPSDWYHVDFFVSKYFQAYPGNRCIIIIITRYAWQRSYQSSHVFNFPTVILLAFASHLTIVVCKQNMSVLSSRTVQCTVAPRQIWSKISYSDGLEESFHLVFRRFQIKRKINIHCMYFYITIATVSTSIKADVMITRLKKPILQLMKGRHF